MNGHLVSEEFDNPFLTFDLNCSTSGFNTDMMKTNPDLFCLWPVCWYSDTVFFTFHIHLRTVNLLLQETSNKELSTLAKAAFELLKWRVFCEPHLQKVVSVIHKSASDSNWRTRSVALTYLRSFMYRYNCEVVYRVPSLKPFVTFMLVGCIHLVCFGYLCCMGYQQLKLNIFFSSVLLGLKLILSCPLRNYLHCSLSKQAHFHSLKYGKTADLENC